ncbi:unnamed protein product [Callosobruchus maculatus]|uniref:Glyoxylate reductase/hydroxypyruvate reductase n=1 Tax=Callosobruchus maculatus TaxID=64391 RepID=A0A653DF07_CALMS|nr:unnamed protein product [Callosobruchus maculatus]
MANANYFSSNKPPKVLVTCPNTPKMGITFLKENGCQIIMLEKSSEEDVLKHIAEVDALLLAPPLKLTKRILDVAGGNMKTIATLSAGYDHIDVNDLKRRGIKLGNTPNVVNAAVADIAVLLALAAARRLHEGRLKIENNQWQSDYQWMLGQDVCNSTIGIVGLGGIGQAVAKRLKGFEVRQILYTGHREKPEGEDLGAKFVSLDTLLRDSDFVIICVPLTNETENMCNQDFFSKMKKTAVFVNISRGKVVDQPALIEALKNGTIFAAGLDVMTPEPLPPDHDLLKLPNVVLMPHLGTATVNTENEMSLLAAKNILKGLAGEEMIHPVV